MRLVNFCAKLTALIIISVSFTFLSTGACLKSWTPPVLITKALYTCSLGSRGSMWRINWDSSALPLLWTHELNWVMLRLSPAAMSASRSFPAWQLSCQINLALPRPILQTDIRDSANVLQEEDGYAWAIYSRCCGMQGFARTFPTTEATGAELHRIWVRKKTSQKA